MRPTVLIVDDELRLAEVLAVALDGRDLDAQAVASVSEAEAFISANRVDLVLTDLRMPEANGRDLLHRLRATRPEVPVVIMTAYASVRDAVDLVKEGAFDYVSKPFDVDNVVATIARALKIRETLNENRRLRSEVEAKYRFDHLTGESPAFQAVLRQVGEVCASRATVLLEGESGTGKELVARAIHHNSPRTGRAFVAVNCAAIPESLIEAELFGHAKGAFTGAAAAREGRFVAADGGTLFLDEVGDMPLSVQAKVLRAIQEQSFEPVGSSKTFAVDVRIVAATHKNLRAMVEEKTFREDLFYRLNVFPITLPALRDRPEDILVLARQFLRTFADEMGKSIVALTPAAEAAIQAYSWPGNVRELQNCLERAVIVARGAAIEVTELPRYVLEPPLRAAPEPSVPSDLDAELARLERNFILEALRATSGIQARAAERLGITERSLWHRVKKLAIRVERSVEPRA